MNEMRLVVCTYKCIHTSRWRPPPPSPLPQCCEIHSIYITLSICISVNLLCSSLMYSVVMLTVLWVSTCDAHLRPASHPLSLRPTLVCKDYIHKDMRLQWKILRNLVLALHFCVVYPCVYNPCLYVSTFHRSL